MAGFLRVREVPSAQVMSRALTEVAFPSPKWMAEGFWEAKEPPVVTTEVSFEPSARVMVTRAFQGAGEASGPPRSIPIQPVSAFPAGMVFS